MSRNLCAACSRPERACICAFIVAVNNQIPVVILQHPSEVTQSKGTVPLLQQSLQHCQTIVDEDFTDNQALAEVLAKYYGKVALLYPSEQATELSITDASSHTASQIDNISCLLILDGTWKKAYRMFMTNNVLQTLPQVMLPKGIEGQYQIRKTKKAGALSSLEACCYALSALEGNNERYHPLLARFTEFNQFQLSFRPKSHLANS